MHSVLRKALKQAVIDGLIPRNVCRSRKPPKIEHKEITPLDRQQTQALLKAASGDRLEALYMLAVHTGMREGELLGLKWEDVDLERGVLRLRHALVREGGKVSSRGSQDSQEPPERQTHPRRHRSLEETTLSGS